MCCACVLLILCQAVTDADIEASRGKGSCVEESILLFIRPVLYCTANFVMHACINKGDRKETATIIKLNSVQ